MKSGVQVPVSRDALFVWIDETGEELFSDTTYPLFGLGGCIVPASHYATCVWAPWRTLKAKWFDGPDQPLHAADLRKPSAEQLRALGSFFGIGQFGRVAAVLTDKTQLLDEYRPYHMAASVLARRIQEVAQYIRFESLALIVEESARGDRLAETHLGDVSVERMTEGGFTQLPVLKCFMPKSAVEPGLEVADFIMHAAGGQVRARLSGAAEPNRKDFVATFRSCDSRLSSFLEVLSVEEAKV